MVRVSSIKRLPPQVRELIGELMADGRTLDEILEALRPLRVNVSRSALHRWRKSEEKVREKLDRSRLIADTLGRRLEGVADSKAARMNVELMHSVILDIVLAASEAEEAEEGNPTQEEGQTGKPAKRGNPVEIKSPMGAMLVAKALDHLTKASKTDTELIYKIRQEAAKAMQAKAAEAASRAVQELGMDKKQAAFVRAEILGIEVAG